MSNNQTAQPQTAQPQNLQQALNVLFEGIRKAQKHGDVYTLQEAAALFNSMVFITQSEELQALLKENQ
jgi:hypothetical protein